MSTTPTPTSTLSPYDTAVATAIRGCGKTQIQLAKELGYDKPNIISMFKLGNTHFPPDRISMLAHATGCDALELYRLWFQCHKPGVWDGLIATLLSANTSTAASPSSGATFSTPFGAPQTSAEPGNSIERPSHRT